MIEIKSLNYAYPGSRNGISNFSFSLDKPGVIGLLGKNGAGKTTLLKIIGGLLFPSSGSCRIFGKEVRKRLPETLLETAYLPEEFNLPAISVKNFVKHFSAFYQSFNPIKMEQCLSEFEIRQKDKLKALSFGQKKKFYLSFVLASGSRILILDEPTNGLDIEAKLTLSRLLSEAKTEGRICLISTHNLSEVENFLDQLMVIDEGRFLFHGDTAEIRRKFWLYQPDEYEGEVLYSGFDGKNNLILGLNKEPGRSLERLDIFYAALMKNPEKIRKILRTEEGKNES